MIILVAEDFDDTRSMIKLLLEMKGHEVVEAVNGQEAVDAASLKCPDLILMDLNMPVMDGLIATEQLRRHASTSFVPIVAVTAHCGNGDWRERAFAAGCNECVSKPVDFKLLDDVLARFLPTA